MRKLLISGVVIVLVTTACQALTLISSDIDDVIRELGISVWKGEKTKREMVVEVEALARKYKNLVEAAPPDHPYSLSPDVKRCISALRSLGDMGDNHSLPVFEEMVGSVNWVIRFNGIANYVRVAGVIGSLPFIENVPTDPDYPHAHRHRVYLALEQEIHKNPLSPKDIRTMCAFLLERIQKEDLCAQNADGILCNHLPEYANSIQRMAVAERLSKSGNERFKNLWSAVKTEIEKTPANERKDFRTKGELLDPERKEE